MLLVQRLSNSLNLRNMAASYAGKRLTHTYYQFCESPYHLQSRCVHDCKIYFRNGNEVSHLKMTRVGFQFRLCDDQLFDSPFDVIQHHLINQVILSDESGRVCHLGKPHIREVLLDTRYMCMMVLSVLIFKNTGGTMVILTLKE